MADYNSLREPPTPPVLSGQHFFVPDLCSVPAISLLVLFGELLVVVLLFAGTELTWMRFALLSLFVQWVALVSAGLLCLARPLMARCSLAGGAALAFLGIGLVTFGVGVAADRIMAGSLGGPPDWELILRQLVISGVISALALRYFYVQQQLRLQEQAELRSRIQALQSRIRPHFLFNSMNIIASLIGSDPDTAEAVVEDLSELFRASLNEAGSQAELEDELDLCRRYLHIEALRLGERLVIDWQLAPVPRGVKVPLLTLQPLLENAIYHGIQPLPEGGTIRIRVWIADDEVCVEISNPLAPVRAEAPPEVRYRPVPGAPARASAIRAEGNRMALDNIRHRLSAVYGNRAELRTAERDGQFFASLRFPAAVPGGHEAR